MACSTKHHGQGKTLISNSTGNSNRILARSGQSTNTLEIATQANKHDTQNDAKSADHSTAMNRCALLLLPAELRGCIWELVVLEENSIDIAMFADPKPGAQPPLTATCWQIRRESLPIFYEKNTFCISTYVRDRVCDGGWHPPSLGPVARNVHRLKNVEVRPCDHVRYYQVRLNASLGNCGLCIVEGSGDSDGWSWVNARNLARGQELLQSKAMSLGSEKEMDAHILKQLMKELAWCMMSVITPREKTWA